MSNTSLDPWPCLAIFELYIHTHRLKLLSDPLQLKFIWRQCAFTNNLMFTPQIPLLPLKRYRGP